MEDREYGSRGRVGVGTPQANPTVEPELSACLPDGVSLIATRLTSRDPDARARFLDYVDRLDTTLQTYNQLKLEVFAFACTAASYVIGRAREDRHMADLAEKFGYPIVTGGQAIVAALKHLGVRRIAIAAPYPAWVCDACRAYYTEAGFDVVDLTRIEIASADLRAIYRLGSRDAIATLDDLDLRGVEGIVFTGSGMPTLRAIAAVGDRTGLPTLGTNLCLAWRIGEILKLPKVPGPHQLLNGWQARLAHL